MVQQTSPDSHPLRLTPSPPNFLPESGTSCQKQTCECDKRAAECFQRAAKTYNNSYKNYLNSLCKGSTPSC